MEEVDNSLIKENNKREKTENCENINNSTCKDKVNFEVEAEKEIDDKEKNKAKKQKSKKQSFFIKYLRWPLIVLFTALFISFTFSILSEMALDGATLFVAIIVIIIFMLISVITDIIGVAITAVDLTPFRSMSAKKVSGAKEAIVLIKNADKVASVVADILGDICSILSGAAGVVVTNFFLSGVVDNMQTILIASAVSAIIAGVIIFGKALGKKFALEHCDVIVLLLGKVVKVFTLNKIGNKNKKEKR
ncbi:MAG: hypothetical protein IJZ29_02390 [Clostridia bacterium]|nr:hypothetical protein [Clostridia bacterium]